MRKIAMILVLLLLLALPVSAYSGITSAQNQTSISANGSCNVTLSITLELDAVPRELVFPIPGNAADITVNGSYVAAPYNRNTRNIDLSGYIANPGTYTFVIRYSQPDVILMDGDKLTLELELLSGFEYPIEGLSFEITLPGAVEERPNFSSMYYQDTVETMMTIRQTGNLINGMVDQRLQDHETLTMTLAVTEDMFPIAISKRWSMGNDDMLMLAISALALIYWLVSMRCLPPRRIRRTTQPEGISAGAIGSCLTGSSVDLTMMVISWAQMGYILIQPDDNGRILLHKRMDMGNERSDLEAKLFRQLFGKRRVVDGTGYHYADLYRRASKYIACAQDNYQRRSGNPKVFLFLLLLLGPISGVSMALAFSADLGWRIVLGILLSLLGIAVAWLMQQWGYAFHSRKNRHFWLGLAAAALWLMLSIGSGEWTVGLCVVIAQMVGGLASAYGGMRTVGGKQTLEELLGLRHYLKHLSSDELKRILRANPHFYYDMVPYAMALGVDKSMTRHLRNARLPECLYLTTGNDGHQTVAEWNELLHRTVEMLDALPNRLPIDRLLGK